MARYAERTTVPVERSQDEIRKLLGKHGVEHFALAASPERAAIQFTMDGLPYRFEVEYPSELKQSAADQEWRRRWRARVLWLKATLEFASSEGPDVAAQALMAYLLLPEGVTLHDWAARQLPGAYRDGVTPPLQLSTSV